MNIQTDNIVIDLLVDDNFINYIMNPTRSLTEKWTNYFKENPDSIQAANQAKKILLGESEKIFLTDFEAKELESQIIEKCGFGHYN